MTWFLYVAVLAAGFALGRARLGRRASQWAAWQSVGTRPARRSFRYWAMFTVLSAENIGWLLAHPVQGAHAWKHRNDPPPPKEADELTPRCDHCRKIGHSFEDCPDADQPQPKEA